MLLIMYSLVTLVLPSHIPSSHTLSTVECTLTFDNDIRRVYPDFGLVAGQRFLADINTDACSLKLQATSPKDKTRQTSCQNSYPTAGDGVKCSNYATTVMKLANGTIYYCFSNYFNPISTMFSSQHSSPGLQGTCLYDANRRSLLLLNSDLNILYSFTDTMKTDQASVSYINLNNGKSKVVDALVTTNIEKYVGAFLRGDFLYSVNLDSESKSTLITRSCKDDKASPSTNPKVRSFTHAPIKCTVSGIDFNRAVSLEYNVELDKLFILFTRYPDSLSAVALCDFSVTHIDTFFDTAVYIGYNEFGAEVKKKQGKIECSKIRSEAVLYKCADTMHTTDTVLTNLGHIRHFTFYNAVPDQPLIYLIDSDRLLIHKYNKIKGTSTQIESVELWLSGVTSFSIYNDKYYIGSGNSLYIGKPYWCSYYGKNPVKCLASQNPSCSYSTERSQCIPTDTCDKTECVQSLSDGSFSTVFPSGYNFTIQGNVCTGDKVYEDKTYTYLPNTTLVITTTARQGCGSFQPATISPIRKEDALSSTVIGLLVPLVLLSIFTIFLILALLRSNSKISCKDNQQSDSVDKAPIIPMDKLTNSTQKNISVDIENGHPTVYKNLSAGALEL